MSRKLSGFAFPFQIVNGGVARSHGTEKVKQNLRHLLSTGNGERVMARSYGAGPHRRRQEPNDAALRSLIRHEMEQALAVHAPEVQLTAPLRLTTREHELDIALEYRADPDGLVQRLEISTD